jgi:hypothetical protein
VSFIEVDYIASPQADVYMITGIVTILDADGNLTTEQGTVPKSDLCKQHDLDVSSNENDPHFTETLILHILISNHSPEISVN